MIGYIINMTPDSILVEVNKYQDEMLVEFPILKFDFTKSDILFKTTNSLNRSHVIPVQFKLIHIWIDIRSNYIA